MVPPRALRLFLIRHGQTALNQAGLLRGELDVPLDATGEREIASLAEALAGVRFQEIVSSPLHRALNTARAVASASGGALRVDERLRDRSYGTWAGASPDDLVARFGSIDVAPGVEPPAEVRRRTLAALADAVAGMVGDGDAGAGESTGSTVAVVTHDVILRVLLGELLPLLDLASLQLPTGCWSELEGTDAGGRWREICIGVGPFETRRPRPAPG